MIRRPPRSTQSRSSAASDVYKRQVATCTIFNVKVLAANLDQACRVGGGVIGVGRISQNDLACRTLRRSSGAISGGWPSCSCLAKGATCRKFPLHGALPVAMLVRPPHTQGPQVTSPSAEIYTHLSQKPCPHSSQISVTSRSRHFRQGGVHSMTWLSSIWWMRDQMGFVARVRGLNQHGRPHRLNAVATVAV